MVVSYSLFYLHHHELKGDLDSDHGWGKSRKMCGKTRINFVAHLFITRRVIMLVFASLIHTVVINFPYPTSMAACCGHQKIYKLISVIIYVSVLLSQMSKTVKYVTTTELIV